MSDPRIPLADPRTLLARYGLQPKKSFGQNFLVAVPVVEKIAALCAPTDACTVVEIGAGLGALTSAILARGAHVIAIERDRELVPILRTELAASIEEGALEVEEADAATVDLAAIFARSTGTRVLAGNLPYQITGRLLERATAIAGRLDRVVVMVQREVADRLVAPAAGEAYGQLSVFAQAAFDVKRALVVGRGCFHPIPGVDSAVVVLTPRSTPRARETEIFRRVVHAAFGARRKTLRNALAEWTHEPVARAAIDATAIDLGRRGETLTVEEFAAIASAIEGACPRRLSE